MGEIRKPQVFGNFKATKPERKTRARDQRPGVSAAHCDLIRKLPCCVINCHADPAGTIHHLKSGPAKAERGMGLRSTDRWGVPMCPLHHEQIEHVGSRGEVDQFAQWGLHPFWLARVLWAASPDFEKMDQYLREIKAA